MSLYVTEDVTSNDFKMIPQGELYCGSDLILRVDLTLRVL
jgi:hypothetical protein